MSCKCKPEFFSDVEEEFDYYYGWRFSNNNVNIKFSKYFEEKSIELKKIIIYSIIFFKIFVILSYFFYNKESLNLCSPFITTHLIIIVINITCNILNFKIKRFAIRNFLYSICFSLCNLNLFVSLFSQALYYDNSMEVNFIFLNTFNSYIYCAAYFVYYDNIYPIHFCIQNLLRIGGLIFVKNIVKSNLTNFLLMIFNNVGLSLIAILAKFFILKIFKLNFKKTIQLNNSIDFFLFPFRLYT